MNLNTLQTFRHEVYACFGTAKDVLFNTVDALLTEDRARSFPELSLPHKGTLIRLKSNRCFYRPAPEKTGKRGGPAKMATNCAQTPRPPMAALTGSGRVWMRKSDLFTCAGGNTYISKRRAIWT